MLRRIGSDNCNKLYTLYFYTCSCCPPFSFLDAFYTFANSLILHLLYLFYPLSISVYKFILRIKNYMENFNKKCFFNFLFFHILGQSYFMLSQWRASIFRRSSTIMPRIERRRGIISFFCKITKILSNPHIFTQNTKLNF